MTRENSRTSGTTHSDLIHDLFRAQAKALPDSIAIIDGTAKMTYREVDQVSDALAGLIHREAGIGPGDIVPVVLHKSTQLITVLLAVLKLGAAYAVLDPTWPARRLGDIAERLGGSGAAILGAGTSSEPFPSSWRVPARVPKTGTLPPPAITPAITGADVAMVFFTSGTSGAPKAVLSPHRGTTRLLEECPFVQLGPGTVMPVTAPPPWDAFSLEVWGSLLTGGACVLPGEPLVTPSVLRGLIRDHGVNTTFLTTSLFHLTAEEDVLAFHGLRTVMVGGERMSPEHALRFLSEHPSVRLVNGYGPVESTVFALFHDVREEDTGGEVPLGRPVPRTRVTIMDGDRVCAEGETGEICIAGDGLARGYLGAQELTDQKFVRLPVDGRPTRLYRTGDLGHEDGNGVIHFSGRADRQVKVSGHRVEPDGIEVIARGVPGVRRCVLVPLSGAGGGYESLALFYTRAPEGPTEERLAEELRQGLPGYAMPDRVHEVEAFPLSTNGKTDTAALVTALGSQAPPPAVAPGAPGMETLNTVTSVFAGVLGHEPASPRTSFFEMGGTSLAAIRTCVRLGHAFDRVVPISQLMRTPSPEGLTAWLDESPSTADRPRTKGPSPMVAGQTGFLLSHLDPETDSANHCSLCWELSGPVDTRALAEAVEDVHQRHGYLSSAYELADSALAVPSSAPSRLDVASAVDMEEAERLLRRRLAEPFDLFEGRVWRSSLVRVGRSDRWLLGISVHHVAFDGWSEHVIARDLAIAYTARCAGVPPGFGEPAPSTAQVSDTLARASSEADQEAQREYWRRSLSGVPALRLGPGSDHTARAPTHEQVLAPRVLHRVDEAARRQSCGRLAVLVNAVADTLRTLTGQEDFAVGVPVTRRLDESLERVVGCLIDTVCVRLRSGHDPLATARAVTAALAHSDLSFSEVVRACAAGSAPGNRSLFQVLAAVQESPEPVLELGGTSSDRYRLDSGAPPPAELAVELFVGTDTRLRVSADPGFVRPGLVEEVSENVVKRLQRI